VTRYIIQLKEESAISTKEEERREEQTVIRSKSTK
jgi:hypothetical protein